MPESSVKRLDRVVVAAVMALACVVADGCRRPSFETVRVRGTMTYQGKPVAGGIIRFLPVDAKKGRSAFTATGSGGAYEVKTLSDSPGLVPGEYLVTATNQGPSGGPAGGKSDDQTSDHTPARTKTGLKLSVRPDDKEVIFNITLDE
jgi:hypothetical protein